MRMGVMVAGMTSFYVALVSLPYRKTQRPKPAASSQLPILRPASLHSPPRTHATVLAARKEPHSRE